MQVSLFTQSLLAFSFDRAIDTAAEIGFSAVELACVKPHFDLDWARRRPETAAERIRHAGLTVSALSLFNSFTDRESLDTQISDAEVFVRLAPLFGTRVVKLTPGPPSSAEAGQEHWRCLEDALARLAAVARETGVRLAVETHMRQLTDTLTGSRRLLDMTPADTIGLTVDFCNLAFAGEDLAGAVPALQDRMFNAHVKNGYVDAAGGWQFQALNEGLVDYPSVLGMLRDLGYDGYLAIECLGPEASAHPALVARRDLETLIRYMKETGISVTRERKP
jgi:sugar phosphate isomerase/epimerase